MGAQTTIARSIAGYINIYPTATLRGATLCYVAATPQAKLALVKHSNVALVTESATFWVLRYFSGVANEA